MITRNELQRAVQRLDRSDATYFEYEGPQGILRLRFSRKPGSHAPRDDVDFANQAPPGAGEATMSLKSPGIGFFCVRHPLTGLEAIQAGEGVKEGQILAFLCAGELLTPVLSDRNATAIRQVAAEGALVGYGQVLFELS